MNLKGGGVLYCLCHFYVGGSGFLFSIFVYFVTSSTFELFGVLVLGPNLALLRG